MSLTSEDLAQVRDLMVDVVTNAIQTVVMPRFDDIDEDTREIKGDIRVLKDDVAVLKEDVAVLKEDVAVLKEDVAILKEDVAALKSETREVKEGLGRLEGDVDAMEADIKELYAMVAKQKPADADKKFAKLPVEQKLLKLYEDFHLLAKEAGITLPN